MSHAWLLCNNGPFEETDNEKLAANLLCDVAGFKLPFPIMDGFNFDSQQFAELGAQHLEDVAEQAEKDMEDKC